MRWLRGALIVSALVMAAAHPATAAWQTGNDLYTECPKKTGFTFGYIEGVIDALQTENGPFCMPDSVIAGQLKDVVCDDLRQNPKDRDKSAAVLVYSALRRAWPCK